MSTTSCCPACATASTCCRRTPTPRSSASTSSKAKAAPGVLAVLTGADAAADKLGALTAHLMPEDFGAPEGPPHLPAAAGLRPRPLRRRPGRLRRRRDAGAGARRRRTGRGRLRAAAGGGQYRGRRQARRAQGVGRQSERQQRLPPDVRQQGGDRRGLRQGQARGQAARREQPHVAGRRWSRASPSATTTRPTISTRSTRPSQNPHGVRMELSHVLPRAGEPDPRGLAGRRRRLRPQGRAVPRRRAGAVGVAQARAGR